VIGTLIFVVIAVTIVSAVFHVTAGWAWIIVIAAIIGLVAYRAKNPLPYKRVTKMGAVFSSVCPYCGKHTKSAAVVCNHCGRSLVVATKAAPNAEPQVSSNDGTAAARLAILDDLKNRAMISPDEYAERRAAVLAEI
jgi:hypothetical protein